MSSLSVHRRGILLTTAILAAWAFLAVRSPHLTYHFAPLLAGAAWPIAIRREEPQPVRFAAFTGLAAFVFVGTTSIVLALAGYMEGPTFWERGPAVYEALLFAAIASAFGVRVASRENPGLLGRLMAD